MAGVGIKETTELLTGANEVGVLVVKALKDGLQAQADFESVYTAILLSAELKAKLLAAYDGAQLVPTELGDLDFIEGAKLGILQASYIPKYLAALKK
jgi:hypothetical protein